MTLTKTQKIYGAVMIVAMGALVWDRSAIGPKTAEAGTGAGLLLQPPRNPASEVRVGRDDSATSFAATAAGHRFRQRLAVLARDRQLDPSISANAFSLPKTWIPTPVDAAPVGAVTSIVETRQKRADAFRLHHLGAVMVGHRGYANVDGQGVFVGEAFDDFKLLSVTKTAAVFESEGVQVELRLVSDPKLNRKGSVIENATPQGGPIPSK